MRVTAPHIVSVASRVMCAAGLAISLDRQKDSDDQLFGGHPGAFSRGPGPEQKGNKLRKKRNILETTQKAQNNKTNRTNKQEKTFTFIACLVSKLEKSREGIYFYCFLVPKKQPKKNKNII